MPISHHRCTAERDDYLPGTYSRPRGLWASMCCPEGSGRDLSSTQHRVGVASLRSEQQYLYGIATVLTVPVMLFETLLTVTCFVSVSPEEYKKWYLLGDRFSIFSVFCGFLRQFLALCSHLFVKSALILFDVCLS